MEEAAIFVSVFVALFVAILLPLVLLGRQWRAAEEKGQAAVSLTPG